MKPIERLQWLANEIYYFTHKSNYPIAQFKNKYLGQKCFIVGNGPSLKASDLEKINELGIKTFAANKIYKIFEETSWRPTFISIADWGILETPGVLENIEKSNAEMFFTRSNFAKMVSKLSCPTCVINTQKDSKSLLKTPQFSFDCSKIIYPLATVTYFALQIAVYMGFKEIYLIGIDHNYANTRMKDGSIIHNNTKSYFGNQEKEEKSIVANSWEMDIAYNFAKKVMEKNDFKIFNATRGGKLETFERINLDDFFNK